METIDEPSAKRRKTNDAIRNDEASHETVNVSSDEEKESSSDSVNINEHENLKSLLLTWNVSPLYERLEACGINIQNMGYLQQCDLDRILGNRDHLLGHMITFRHFLHQWKPDSASASRKNSTEAPKIEVMKIISNSNKGKKILKNYNEHNLLDFVSRLEVIHLILDKTFAEGLTLSRPTQKNIAEQICKIFPTEKKDIYYEKEYKKQPTGLFYQCYNKRRAGKTSVATSEEIRLSTFTDGSSSNSLPDIVEASIRFLQNYDYKSEDLDSSTIMHHWKQTYQYRQSKMKCYKTTQEAIDTWPVLECPDGYMLLCMDFAEKYGRSIAESLMSNFDQFFIKSKNIDSIKDIIADPFTKRDLQSLESLPDQKSKIKTIFFALHHLCMPASMKVGGMTWRPTIIQSKEVFLKAVLATQIDSVMAERYKFCKSKNIKNHPMIFEIRNETKYVVGLCDIKYEFDNLLEAVDVTFKIFKNMNIEFPPESKKVWEFINECFYKIQGDKVCAQIASIVHSLKH